MKLRKLHLFLFLLSIQCFSQQFKFSGSVIDKASGEKISNALVVLTELTENQLVSFVFTNNQGLFVKELENKKYMVEIKHLGHITVIDSVLVDRNIQRSFHLNRKTEVLDQIFLITESRFNVKKDSVIYNVDYYRTGQEKKLKDILKKLPGLEVDRNGNVTSNGKSVKRLLVEGKAFFTGDEKLGVNNIPADAVDEVQLLDNYSEVAMLKQFEDTDELVMNIKLKEDKKRFVFGDVTAGAGYKERYKINPALFYYSPEYAANFIGDLNNNGVKSFTSKDYIDFNGGILNISPTEYFKLNSDQFAQFLNNRDFTNSVDRFGAGSYRKSWKKSDLSGYVIFNDANISTASQTINEYQTDTPFKENRQSNGEQDGRFLIAKVDLKNQPSKTKDLRINSLIKFNNATDFDRLVSQSTVQNTFLESDSEIQSFSSSTNLLYTSEINKKHTYSIQANVDVQDNTSNYLWNTDRLILSGLIPLEQDDQVEIVQDLKNSNFNIGSTLKHYYKISSNTQLQSSLTGNYLPNTLETTSFQLRDDTSTNSFNPSGFDVDLNYNVFRSILGTELRTEQGKFTFKPSLLFQYFNQQIDQTDQVNRSQWFFAPKLRVQYDITNSERLYFNFNRNISVPNSQQLVDRLFLSSFNAVTSGNPQLDYRISERYSLRYSKFNLYKGLSLNAGLSYNNQIQGIKSTTVLQGIDQIRNYIDFGLDEKSLNANFSINKTLGNIKYGFNSSHRFSNYYQILNEEINENKTQNTSIGLTIKTLFDQLPTLSLSYQKTFNNYDTSINTINTFQDRFAANLDYEFLNDFVFEFSYNLNLYKNESIGVDNQFDDSFFSLSYDPENTPWTYKLTGTNLFDNRFRQVNSFNDFLITDRQTFLQPRIVMFELSYKL
ncbi:outer membrane beta-barrel protein [Nonlabens dokdonensis]|uniref:outer membrane beta-barrel protein n=1 Tax=Nonlabens dokdonensis TaxID=328515 RepID=UPI0026A09866|nr:outer membrane beta-barrel protein [Nonlabens dokdonensis]